MTWPEDDAGQWGGDDDGGTMGRGLLVRFRIPCILPFYAALLSTAFPLHFECAPQAVYSFIDCQFDLPILSCRSSFRVYYFHRRWVDDDAG